MAEQTPDQASAQDPAQGHFAIQRIYCKDISFETPNSPHIFQQQWQPQADLQIDTQATDLGNGTYDITLSITATVKVEDKTAFLVEVNQAGIFTASGIPEEQLGPMLGAFCPNILFPYAREAISDISARGGFPPLILSPVNFDALYAQRMQQQQAAAAGSTVQ
jgi:preprotein translocase subunit SecB